MSVTKQDILKPEGQKFGMGDLVRVRKEEDGIHREEGLHRVIGSYFQLHGDRDNDRNWDGIDPRDLDADELEELEEECQAIQIEKEEYALCHVEDREAMWAWCDESRMEAVEESL